MLSENKNAGGDLSISSRCTVWMSAGSERPHNWRVNGKTGRRHQTPAARRHLQTTSHCQKGFCGLEREADWWVFAWWLQQDRISRLSTVAVWNACQTPPGFIYQMSTVHLSSADQQRSYSWVPNRCTPTRSLLQAFHSNRLLSWKWNCWPFLNMWQLS